MRKIFIAHLCFIMISGAFFYVKPDGPNLVWNMFLALLALNFAYASYMTLKKPLLSWLTLVLWILFYPNTFYMLTDVIYFSWANDILWQRPILIRFAIFVSAILLGVLCGVLSVGMILERLKIRKSAWRYTFMVTLSVLSSLAIHIGRYARLNSWDVLLRPRLVLAEMLSLIHGKDTIFIVVFSFFQIMTLLLLDSD